MKEDLVTIKEDTYSLPDSTLVKLQKDIEEIKVALLGNEYNPTAGLLYRMTCAENHIDRLRTKLDRIVWTAGGAAIILSVVFNLLMDVLNKFIIH